MHFIHGNGPRKDVCAHCGVKMGLVSEEEAVNLFSNEVANARLNLVSRRWAPFFWVTLLWNAWFFFIRDVNIWNWVSNNEAIPFFEDENYEKFILMMKRS